MNDEPFDPLSGLFVAQRERPADLRPLNLRALAPAQRALLVIDGTVTRFLEAFTMERIDVQPLGQREVLLDHDDRWLDAGRGTRTLAREVALRGAWSDTIYAFARSWIVPSRMPPEARRQLREGVVGLGRILLGMQLETRREVLWCGQQHDAELPDALSALAGQPLIVRSYRIIAAGAPLMRITEKFPAAIEHALFDG